ncbi:hypothetical protein [Dankookia sp. P2]
MKRAALLVGAAALALAACDGDPGPEQHGASPQLPAPSAACCPTW